MLFRKGQHMFATVDSEEARQKGRDYIKRMGLISENAKMGPKDGFLIVILKEDVEL
jgi:hypothetical protein